MTFISKYAQALKLFLLKELKIDETEKFKIFIRTGFQIDVYIFVHDCQYYTGIKQKFDNFCNETESFSDLESIKENDYIKIFFKVLPVTDLEDSFYSNIVNNPNNIDYGPRYRFDSFYSTSKINLTKDDKTEIPIITFYSHKGGVGRTTAMTSYALHLAAQGKSVAIIDCDLEAPGYLNFFDLSEHEELIEGKKNGLVEFLCDTQFMGKDVEIKDYMLNAGARNQNSDNNSALNRIWIIPAGNLNEGVDEKNALKSPNRQDYVEALAKLNLGNTQKVIKSFSVLFEQLKEKVDAILIDSRTGFNDIFGTATLHLSSCVVGFFGLSRQNEPGLINLLAKHIQNENLFKLIIAYSILPKNFGEDPKLMKAYKRMESFIKKVYAEKEVPPSVPLYRNPILERLGTGDKDADEKFIDMNTTAQRENQFSDYVQLFNDIDKLCFPLKSRLQIVPSKPTKEYGSFALRNIVLQRLKKVLSDVAKPAENIVIDPNTFFYRKCMGNRFFERQSFIICGCKGTGKTYFRKAIRNSRILGSIREMASAYIFADALSTQRKDYMFLIQCIKYMFVKKEDFLNFWRICTWVKLLFDESIEGLSEIRSIVKQQSALTHEYDENIFVSAAFIELMDVDKLFNIISDIRRFNEELKRTNKKVYILYDQLESFIQPDYWNEAISSLINYWTGPGIELSNILPKIFIRTDLLSQVENLNTELSSSNIVNMEWSIEEVFGYFFKLIFSDPAASAAYWALAETFNIDSQYIDETAKLFRENRNQFNSPSQAEMEPLLRVFFGEDTRRFGKPWDYFKKELSNADGTVNLQAFINILNKNAVDKALAIAESDVSEIISPQVYTSTEVRTFAVTELFRSQMTDAYSKDLIEFQYIVLFGNGGLYRYKSLDGTKFENLIDETCKRLDIPNTRKHKALLINLIFANGIMAVKHTTKGDVYEFAPLYWFPWGLQDEDEKSEDGSKNNDEDPELKKIENVSKFIEGVGNSAIGAGLKEFGAASIAVGAAVGSVVNIATDIAKLISKLNNKK